jgi:hypothetical protein
VPLDGVERPDLPRIVAEAAALAHQVVEVDAVVVEGVGLEPQVAQLVEHVVIIGH